MIMMMNGVMMTSNVPTSRMENRKRYLWVKYSSKRKICLKHKKLQKKRWYLILTQSVTMMSICFADIPLDPITNYRIPNFTRYCHSESSLYAFVAHQIKYELPADPFPTVLVHM